MAVLSATGLPAPDNVVLTSLKQPEDGSVFLTHCPLCGLTEIGWSSLGVHPKDGDLWVLEIPCSHHLPNPLNFEVQWP